MREIDLEWQPIDTAPRDGSRFVAWSGHELTIAHYVQYDDYGQWEDQDCVMWTLTHWLCRIPDPPKSHE